MSSIDSSLRFYLAGPMRGIAEFNYPAFHAAAAKLREAGHYVFSPAERDIERHGGVDISKGNTDGCEHRAAAEHGFSLREALKDDLSFICLEADAIALLPGWRSSKGAKAELATAIALGHRVFEVGGGEFHLIERTDLVLQLNAM